MARLLLAWILLQANTQPGGTVTGRVLGPDGEPVAGVRVYAMALKEGLGTSNTTSLETITQTDESGRYQLVVRAGRYHVAAGPVETPTFSPGTSKIAAARVLTVAPRGFYDMVDVPGFAPPVVTQLIGKGVLSGVIRYPDGEPAVGLPVIAFARAVSFRANAPVNPPPRLGTARTDAAGRYLLSGIFPETYIIAAGFADSPTFYPGTTAVDEATWTTTTQTTNLANLDFSVARPPVLTTVRGKVSSEDGAPLGNAAVSLRLAGAAAFPLLPQRHDGLQTTGPDGLFTFANVIPGTYSVDASALKLSRATVMVAEPPGTDVNLSLPVAVLWGQVLLEDGSELPDAPLLKAVHASTINNPNFIQTTVLPLDKSGRFSKIVESNEYRIRLQNLPEGYVVKSIASGPRDLLKENLKVGASTTIEIRLARVANNATSGVKVSGVVMDPSISSSISPSISSSISPSISSSISSSTAQTVTLCCFSPAPYETRSTTVRPDGSFEFSGIPPGNYLVEIGGRFTFASGDPNITVGRADISGLKLTVVPPTPR